MQKQLDEAKAEIEILKEFIKDSFESAKLFQENSNPSRIETEFNLESRINNQTTELELQHKLKADLESQLNQVKDELKSQIDLKAEFESKLNEAKTALESRDTELSEMKKAFEKLREEKMALMEKIESLVQVESEDGLKSPPVASSLVSTQDDSKPSENLEKQEFEISSTALEAFPQNASTISGENESRMIISVESKFKMIISVDSLKMFPRKDKNEG